MLNDFESQLPLDSDTSKLRKRIGDADFAEFFDSLIEQTLNRIQLETNVYRKNLLVELHEAQARIYTKILAFNNFTAGKKRSHREILYKAGELNERIRSDFKFIASHQDLLF